MRLTRESGDVARTIRVRDAQRVLGLPTGPSGAVGGGDPTSRRRQRDVHLDGAVGGLIEVVRDALLPGLPARPSRRWASRTAPRTSTAARRPGRTASGSVALGCVVLVGASIASQRVAALLGDLGRADAQPQVVGDVQPGALVADPRHPAHEPADRLAEEQVGGRDRRVHADPQARDVDALPTPSGRPPATRPCPPRSASMRDGAVRVIRGDHDGRRPGTGAGAAPRCPGRAPGRWR